MDLKEIQNLIKFVANSGVAEVKLEMDDIKIIRTTIEGTVYVQLPAHNQQAMPVQNAAPVAAVVDTPVVEENKYITIKSPIIGTFIESQPDKPMFVEVGTTIEKVTFFVIEAMKLFNEIESEVSGKIVKY
jgi:acetyl-CoA carboxylase biotin carboxyl carrier protein